MQTPPRQPATGIPEAAFPARPCDRRTLKFGPCHCPPIAKRPVSSRAKRSSPTATAQRLAPAASTRPEDCATNKIPHTPPAAPQAEEGHKNVAPPSHENRAI